jgi:hypothetical protein
MNKLYIATTTKMYFRTLMLTIFLAGMAAVSKAQIAVTATAGTATGTYTTLKGAFDAINLGTHQGIINISINGNTTETATAVLNSSNTPSNYSSVII